jgi:hypothetical protein
MAEIALADLTSGKYSISKGAVFIAEPAWDFNSDLELEYLGFTEGDVELELNEEFQTLTLDEYTGGLAHEAFVQGEGPVCTIPLFTGDPALRAKLSPTGGASGGYQRQLPVATKTLVVFPERLFLSADGQLDYAIEYDGSAWSLNGQPLTTDQERLLGQSIWIWRGYFSKPNIVYRHNDAGKSVDPVTFTAMYQPLAPNGHRAYTLGDPVDAGIDISSGLIGS